MRIIKKESFKVGAWYKTGYHTEQGGYIEGLDAKCVSISPDREKAVFLIGGKKQEYDLIGEMVHSDFVENEEHERGFAKSETAVMPWVGSTPTYGPYASLCSHNFVSRIAVARKKAGLSQAQLSELFDIPKRTIENWEAGVNIPKEYTENIILEKLEEMATENAPEG